MGNSQSGSCVGKVRSITWNVRPSVSTHAVGALTLDDFSTLCFVRADLSPLTASAKAMTGQGGKKYWTIVFSIEIHFGLTEFRARIKWNDDVSFIFFSVTHSNIPLLSGESEIVSSRQTQTYLV